MKLIVMTTSEFFVEENSIITSLFEKGLDMLHLRKPDSEPLYCERLLTLIPNEYCKKIVVHDHFYLKEEFNLRGVHLNRRNLELPQGYKGHISRSCHSFEELKEYKKKYDYLFLSPIYNTISKSVNRVPYTYEQLKTASKAGIIDKRVMALGGVTSDNIRQMKDLGFGGVVVLGDLWNRFNIHTTRDYKEVIRHFEVLRKAAD